MNQVNQNDLYHTLVMLGKIGDNFNKAIEIQVTKMLSEGMTPLEIARKLD